METCADCGKIIAPLDASYYRKEPADDIGQIYHAQCGPWSACRSAYDVIFLRDIFKLADDPNVSAEAIGIRVRNESALRAKRIDER